MKVCPLCQMCFADEILTCSEEDHPQLIKGRKGDREVIAGCRLEVLEESSATREVYLATNTTLNKSCLVEIINSNVFEGQPLLRERFLRETQDLSAVNHPNLVAVLERGILSDGSVYLISEYFAEKTLRDFLDEKNIKELIALKIARQIAEGLNEIHKAGVLHKNICPKNIILTFDEENQLLVKIRNIDFGGIRGFQTNTSLDELKYFSPEQCAGKSIDSQTDIYALGILLFEMLAGKTPFDASDSKTLIHKQIKENPPPIQIDNFNIRALLTHTLTDSLQKRKRLRLKNANIFARRLSYIEQIAAPSLSLMDKQFQVGNETLFKKNRDLPEEILANLPTEELPPLESIIGELLSKNETETEDLPKEKIIDFNSYNNPILVDWEQPEDIPPMPKILEKGAESFSTDFAIEPIFIDYEDSVIDVESNNDSTNFSLEISKPIEFEENGLNKFSAKTRLQGNFPNRRKLLAVAGISILLTVAVGGIWLNRQFQLADETQIIAQNSSNNKVIVNTSEAEKHIENEKVPTIKSQDIPSSTVTDNSETMDLPDYQPREIKQKNISPILPLHNAKRLPKAKSTDCDCSNTIQNKPILKEIAPPKKVEIIVVGSKSTQENRLQNSSESNIFNRPRIIRKNEYGKSF